MTRFFGISFQIIFPISVWWALYGDAAVPVVRIVTFCAWALAIMALLGSVTKKAIDTNRFQRFLVYSTTLVEVLLFASAAWWWTAGFYLFAHIMHWGNQHRLRTGHAE